MIFQTSVLDIVVNVYFSVIPLKLYHGIASESQEVGTKLMAKIFLKVGTFFLP